MSIPHETGGVGPTTVILSVLLVSVLGFFFVTLCARLVGFLGTSSYPLSGQTIGALLVTVLILRISGLSGPAGMATAIVIGAVICIAIALSADASQDLKTGALLGATPYRQQIGEIIGVLISALVAGLIVILFHESGELARLPAPQARMMASIVEGVMTDAFPWLFVGIGIVIAVLAEVIGVSSIMLAVGIYLPVHLASAFVVGGLLRGMMNQKHPGDNDIEQKGTLLSSGMIAGWAIVGVALVGVVALKEFQILELDLALRSLPEPAWSLPFLIDLLVGLLLYVGVVYYFGRVLRLWGDSGQVQRSI
jgi:putative OPT family oligopeptide transporter